MFLNYIHNTEAEQKLVLNACFLNSGGVGGGLAGYGGRDEVGAPQ